MGKSERVVSIVGQVIWYGLAALAGLGIFGSIDSWDLSVDLLMSLISLALVVLIFVLVHFLARAGSGKFTGPSVTAVEGPGESFPSPSTRLVALWLLGFVIFSVVGVIVCMSPSRLGAYLGSLIWSSPVGSVELREAMVMLFGAGIGASITTTLAFLRHTSEEKNFDRAYLPWYVARPLIGMLVGLIFYFLIKGGILLTVRPIEGTKIESLNPWSLAGIGALVGMFSKNAVEKLKEVFHTLFRTNEDSRRRLGMVSTDARKKLLELLPDEVKHVLIFGTGDELQNTLRALPEVAKAKLRAEMPAEVRRVLIPFLGTDLIGRVRALTPDDRKEVMEALPQDGVAALAMDDADAFRKSLDALDDAAKEKFMNDLPDAAKSLFAG